MPLSDIFKNYKNIVQKDIQKKEHTGTNMIKLFKTTIWYFFGELALARRAGILVRQGRKQVALDLMSNNKII